MLELGRISTVVSSVPSQRPRGPVGRGERADSTVRPPIERSGDAQGCHPAARPSAESTTGKLGDKRISKLLGTLGFESSEHIFIAAGVEWEDLLSWSTRQLVDMLQLPDTMAARILVQAQREQRGGTAGGVQGSIQPPCSSSSAPSGARQGSAEATTLPTSATQLAAQPRGSADEGRSHVDGRAAAGQAAPQRTQKVRFLVNDLTGIAHPTIDGVTPSCAHKRLFSVTPSETSEGYTVCTMAKRRG
jgi:hypothetical protein